MANKIENRKSFPIFKTIFGSFIPFLDNFRSFFIIGSVFSVLFIVLNYISGQSFLCLNDDYKKYAFCSGEIISFIVTTLLGWILGCVYMRIWYQTVILKKQKFLLKSLIPSFADLKIYGVILLFILFVFIAVGAGYILLIRVPNPDWRIEILYFSIVSIGFFAPVIATPILSLNGFVAEGEKLPSLRNLWQQAKGNMVMVFISFVSVAIISFLAANSLFRYFMQIASIGNMFVVVMAEFFYNMMVMFLATIFISYCYTLKKFLFERD